MDYFCDDYIINHSLENFQDYKKLEKHFSKLFSNLRKIKCKNLILPFLEKSNLSQISLNKLKGFTAAFLILFIFSPFAYAYISITETDKRTDYPGKEIAEEIQLLIDRIDEIDTIDYVWGNEWVAGNLSYHLKSRPTWINNESFDKFKD